MQLTRHYAQQGACYNTRTPTAYRVFEAGSYKQCVADSFSVNFKAIGLNEDAMN